MQKPVKIAKINDAVSDCHYLYFNYWERNKKHRIYITDYKGRTLGYINMDKKDEIVIEDRQGNMQSEIDAALHVFMKAYLDRFKAKHGLGSSKSIKPAISVPQPSISKGMRIRHQLLERTVLYDKKDKREKAIAIIENALYPDSWWEKHEQTLLLGKMSSAIKLVKHGYEK